MDDKKLTKKVLAEVADDLSKVMDFEKPINIDLDETTEKPVTKAQIIADVKEAGKELLAKDVISDLSREVLIFLKVKLPELVAEMPPKLDDKIPEEKKTPKATKADKAGENEKKEKKIEPKPPEKDIKKIKKYTRSKALIDAFGKGIKTRTELIKTANTIYIDNGGADNINVAKALLGYVMPSLLILKIVIEVENGKYQLAGK